jgi:glyoxylase-like metal-dependent hydrolase (beta-lactamase superfamily II)
MLMEHVIIIPALSDNYIYLCRYDQNNAFAIDPGDSRTVLKTIQELGLNLTDVLTTHHHFDHTAGIEDLKKKTVTLPIKPEMVAEVRAYTAGKLPTAGLLKVPEKKRKC